MSLGWLTKAATKHKPKGDGGGQFTSGPGGGASKPSGDSRHNPDLDDAFNEPAYTPAKKPAAPLRQNDLLDEAMGQGKPKDILPPAALVGVSPAAAQKARDYLATLGDPPPPPKAGMTRLYRGEHDGKSPHEHAFFVDERGLAGVAIPFAKAGGRYLGYVDVPHSVAKSGTVHGATDGETQIPQEFSKQIQPWGSKAQKPAGKPVAPTGDAFADYQPGTQNLRGHPATDPTPQPSAPAKPAAATPPPIPTRQPKPGPPQLPLRKPAAQPPALPQRSTATPPSLPHHRTQEAALNAARAMQSATDPAAKQQAHGQAMQALQAHHAEGIKHIQRLAQQKYGNSPQGKQAAAKATAKFTAKVHAVRQRLDAMVKGPAQPPPVPQKPMYQSRTPARVARAGDHHRGGIVTQRKGLGWLNLVLKGWVTLDPSGTHVFIGDDGNIERGPAHMVGKKPSELSKKKPAESGNNPSTKVDASTGVDHNTLDGTHNANRKPEGGKMHADAKIADQSGLEANLSSLRLKIGETKDQLLAKHDLLAEFIRRSGLPLEDKTTFGQGSKVYATTADGSARAEVSQDGLKLTYEGQDWGGLARNALESHPKFGAIARELHSAHAVPSDTMDAEETAQWRRAGYTTPSAGSTRLDFKHRPFAPKGDK